MRGSLITDIAQAILLIVALIFIVPQDSLGTMLATGSWTLEGGVDFIIGAGLQCLSYGFHDAVLTDCDFLCEEKKMLRAFTVAGILGFIAILLFSLIAARERSTGVESTWTGFTDEEIAACEKARLEADPNLESVVAVISRQQAIERDIEVEAHPGVDGPTGA